MDPVYDGQHTTVWLKIWIYAKHYACNTCRFSNNSEVNASELQENTEIFLRYWMWILKSFYRIYNQ